MNKIKYLFLTVSALAFTACNTDNIGAIYKGEDGVASFVQSVLNDNEVAIAATEYYVPVRRQTNVGDLTVNFTADPLKGKIKCPSTSVTFADGEYEARIKLDITDIVLGQKDTIKFELAANVSDKNIGYNDCSVILARGYTWESIGKGEYVDTWVAGAIVDVEIKKAEGFDIYRVYDPYNKDIMMDPELMGEEYAWTSDNFGDPCEYFEFYVDGDDISWKTYSAVYYIDGLGTVYNDYWPEKGAYAEFLNDDKTVIGFTPFIWNPDSGKGWGVIGETCFLSMPGGPSLEEFLN